MMADNPTEKCTSLHIAAAEGKTNTVEGFVKNGGDINSKDKKGMTPLHLAVQRNHTDTVKYLVEQGADINVKDGNKWTPLHMAARKGHDQMVEFLVDKEADIDITDYNGWTPLHVAVSEDYKHTVTNLVEKGASIYIQDNRGMTPLHIAAEKGRYRMVKYLVGITPNISTEDHDGRTPLHIAAREGHDGIVEYLVKQSADINIKDKKGRTPMHVAAERGHCKIVEYLVGKGFDIDIQNGGSRTPLHIAAREGHDETVKFLVEKEANINSIDVDGMTPLHMAAERGHVKIVEYLVCHGANINTKDHNGRTPLHAAAKEGRDYTVEFLVGKGANINLQDHNERTPRHVADERGHMKIAQFLSRDRISDEVDHFSHLERNQSKKEAAVTPPKITWHPENQSVAFGDHVVFSIEATGENLQFQWQKNGSDLSDNDKYCGVNTDTLSIVAVKGDDEGDYGCLVKNDVGKLVSDAALLTLVQETASVFTTRDTMQRKLLQMVFEAAFHGYTEALEMLLCQFGVPVNSEDQRNGFTLLMYACKAGREEMVKMLLSQAKKPNCFTRNKNGQSVVHIAASEGKLDCLKNFAELENAVELLQMEDKNGWNVLHHICTSDENGYDILHWLLEEFTHCDLLKTRDFLNHVEQESDRYSPLLLACKFHKTDLVKYLLKFPEVDPSLKTSDGLTCLHLAAKHDAIDIAQEVIARDCPIDSQDKFGNTALHIARKEDSTRVEQLLRQKGGDNLTLLKNKSPPVLRIVAQRAGHPLTEVDMKTIGMPMKDTAELMGACRQTLYNKIQEGKTADDLEIEIVIPIEIERRGQEAVKIYRNALQEIPSKEMQVPCCKLLILGDSGTGKSSLLRLLTGQLFIPEHISTEGIDTSLVQTRTIGSVDMQTLVTLREDGQFSQFNDLAGAEICERVKNVNCYSIMPNHLPIKTFKSEDEMISELKRLWQIQVEPNSSDTKVKATLEKSPQQSEERQRETEPQNTQKQSSHLSSAKKYSPPPEIIRSRRLSEIVVERLNHHNRTEPEMRLVTWDFAGQPLYHPMHHCFITYRAMYIVTFKLNEIVESEKKESVYSQIAFWLNTIQAHVRHDEASDDSIPPIFLVGTFRDTPSKNGIKVDDQMLNSISRELREHFLHVPVENRWLKHIQFYDSERIFAAIENCPSNRDEGKESGAEMLQRKMLETMKGLRFIKEKRPLKWLKFEEIIFAKRKETKDGKKPLLAERTKLHEEASELKFSDEEFDLLLQFFHDLGTIVNPRELPTLFLSEDEKAILHNVIILDPQWLVKIMTELMKVDCGCKRNGLAKQSFLKSLWNGYLDRSSQERSFQQLCLFLKAFCLIIPASSVNISTNQASLYLIPCKLKGKDEPPQSPEYPEEWIQFYFDFNGYLPAVVFHRLSCLLACATTDPTHENTFRYNYCSLWDIQQSNLWLEMQTEKNLLKAYVKPYQSTNSQEQISLVEYVHSKLAGICSESGLEGIRYIGGPFCPYCKDPTVLPLFWYQGKLKDCSQKITKGADADDSHVDELIIRCARVQCCKESNVYELLTFETKRHPGRGNEQGREREVDHSAVSKSSYLQVTPSKPPHETKSGQRRSLSGSSVSDDSLSPPPEKKNRHKKRRHSSPSPGQTRAADQISKLKIGPSTKRRTDEVNILSSAVNKAKQLGVQFIDPVETIMCDTHGCDYYNTRHDVEIRIPEAAILPNDGMIKIEFGVAMYGPFKITDGPSVKRVSPVVWLCIQQDGFSGFQKDVEITIPHFLDLSTEDAYEYLRFLKAEHQLEDGEKEYQFKPTDGKAVFDRAAHGTLLMRHFCSVCIEAKVSPSQKTRYYLGGGISLKGQDCQIVFYVCYFLKSCVRTAEKLLDKDSEKIYLKLFMFSEGKEVKIIFQNEVSGWLLNVEHFTKISAKDVDFQSMINEYGLEHLELMEERKLYPPNFEITARRSSTAEDSHVDFIFQGATEEIVKRISLNATQENRSQLPPPKVVQQKIGLECVDGTTVLGEDDLHAVRSAVADLTTEWMNLGISLGVRKTDLDIILSANPHSPSNCLREMLTLWLRQSYAVGKFGKPTWRKLVEAAEDKVGGNNPALAQNIAGEHSAASGSQ